MNTRGRVSRVKLLTWSDPELIRSQLLPFTLEMQWLT